MILDFSESDEVQPQHYAFVVTNEEFEHGLARLKNSACKTYKEFEGSGSGDAAGHGVYFEDSDGHTFELITRPYAGKPEASSTGVALKYQH